MDSEPIATVEDLFRRLSGKKYLSKIDLIKGYWQIPVAPEAVHKTAFVTPDGQYEFTRMLSSMVNSGATLVRGLRKILEGMSGVRSYIDDIVIYSDSSEDHLRMLKELFGRLRKAKITARYTKCLLGDSKKQVRSFFGLVGYYRDHIPAYRDHIPAFTEISAPLTDLKKKWSKAQERAYSLLKEYLLQEPVLKLPDLGKPFLLQTDASGVGVASELLQENDGKLYPVDYASKKLNLTEARYPIIEKECLSVVWGIKRFKLYLAGRKFILQNVGADFLSRTGYSC